MQGRAKWRGPFGWRDAIGQVMTVQLGRMTQRDRIKTRPMTLLTGMTQLPVELLSRGITGSRISPVRFGCGGFGCPKPPEKSCRILPLIPHTALAAGRN